MITIHSYFLWPDIHIKRLLAIFSSNKIKIDDLVKSPIAGHCEERSDEAIP